MRILARSTGAMKILEAEVTITPAMNSESSLVKVNGLLGVGCGSCGLVLITIGSEEQAQNVMRVELKKKKSNFLKGKFYFGFVLFGQSGGREEDTGVKIDLSLIKKNLKDVSQHCKERGDLQLGSNTYQIN